MAGTRATSKSSPAEGGELQIGRIVGVFGLGGEVRVHLHNRESSLLDDGRRVVLRSQEGLRREVMVRTRGGAGGRVLASIEGVADREAARALMGWEILVPSMGLPPLPEGEYYHRDLIGLQVLTESGTPLGRLAEIHGHGGVDVWVVRGEGDDVYIPALKRLIVSVDPERREVRVIDECASNS